MKEPFIVLYKKLLNWEWFSDSKTVHLFIYFLLSANWEKRNWRGIEIDRGQLIMGYNSIFKNTGLTRGSYRIICERLKTTGEITIKTTNKYSLITLVKYNDYQNLKIKQPSKQPSKQPTNSHQTTTTNEVKQNKGGGQKISLPSSDEFKFLFAEKLGWSKPKLKYYYEALLNYSNQGKFYSDWISAARAWAAKDEKDGKPFREPESHLGKKTGEGTYAPKSNL